VLAVRDPAAALASLGASGESAFVIGQVEAADGAAGLRFDLPSGFFRA
jgi:hypothetical protein